MSKERRLGRGLEALLGRVAARPEQAPPPAGELGPALPQTADHAGGEDQTDDRTPHEEGSASPPVAAYSADVAQAPPDPGPTRAAIRQIESNPFQPRRDFDDEGIESLADSLRSHGLLQPVVVRRIEGGRYQLIAGERRLRAAVKAGWTDVPVQIIEADDRQTAELAIVENLQREDLNPLEKAASFQRYLGLYGCTQEELASRLKLDRSTIANLIRLLELPEPIKEAVRQGKITQGHARALLPLGDEREQIAFCRRIEQEGLSVRQTEAMVRQAIDAADAEPLGVVDPEGPPSRRPASEHVVALEQEFRSALGTRVKLTHSARGRGRLVIHFANHEEFERLRHLLCHPGERTRKGQVG